MSENLQDALRTWKVPYAGGCDGGYEYSAQLWLCDPESNLAFVSDASDGHPFVSLPRIERAIEAGQLEQLLAEMRRVQTLDIPRLSIGAEGDRKSGAEVTA